MCMVIHNAFGVIVLLTIVVKAKPVKQKGCNGTQILWGEKVTSSPHAPL